ncbi:HAD-IA family hydrolase [Arundinibacter roseus]|uniref:HAD-IA family hydrolase n=1 Tax=Arundinibacter roseus TaxID=2070510 RepID=UPI002693CAA9|nr:HAD-IA family hydrolase [Arundinibacter roseus]
MKEQIKNIVFDLGDVIINIDVPLAAKAFAELSGQEATAVQDVFKDVEIFRKFETGTLSAAGFRAYVRELLVNPDWEDHLIDTAWNALLLDIPPKRIELIQNLRQRYRLFLLSNTSSIHVEAVNKILYQTTGVEQLQDLFEQVFLSYEMGVMKPDAAIYQRVLQEGTMQAHETLFLDDNADNIAAAAALGIQTIHVQKPFTILDYLADYVS